jgi:Zn-dependent protease with chaperone function
VDFYARQAAARSSTRWLVLGFLASLVAVALALDIVLFTALGTGRADTQMLSPLAYAAQNPGRAVFTTLVVVGVLGLASLYKSLELRGGGGIVATSLGGVRVARDTQDLQRKRLHNVVEEMAIASGVPMPEVYVLEQEQAINAFAAGHTPANAAITVTQGALDQLNRDQLQGVIAHEFSHILNGDMRLNIQLMGWIFGLFIVALIGRTILRFCPRGRRGSNGLVAVGLAVVVLGYVGLFLGRLLQSAVSRQRERLADASGVQFTRNPEGLKDALVKIAVAPDGAHLTAADAEQAAHMFFAEALSRVFATHPPILERIKELDPHFKPRDLEAIAAELEKQSHEAGFAGQTAGAGGQTVAGSLARLGTLGAAGAGAAGAVITGVLGSAEGAGAPGSGTAVGGGTAGMRAADVTRQAPIPEHLSAQVGSPQTIHIEQAKAMRLALPEGLREFTESPGHAQALVLALLLSRDETARAKQIELLTGSIGPANVNVVQQAVPLADGLDPMLRLPALQQIFPALRRAPVPQRKALARIADQLIHADSRIDVFEFCLAKLLETLLNDELEARAPHGTASLEDAQNEISVLFATIAQLGAQDERGARMAYEAGMSSVLPMRRPAYQPGDDWAKRLSAALPALEDLHPYAKKAVIEGLVKTISNDDVMTVEEAELLRATCALMHCPLPLLVGFGAPPLEAAEQG